MEVLASNNQQTGYYDLQVYDNGTNQWITKYNEFYVYPVLPNVNWISPNNGIQGQTLSVTISGSNMDYYDNWSNVSSFRFTNWSGGNTFYGNSSYL